MNPDNIYLVKISGGHEIRIFKLFEYLDISIKFLYGFSELFGFIDLL